MRNNATGQRNVQAASSRSFLTERKATTSLVHLSLDLILPAFLLSFDKVSVTHHRTCAHSSSACPANSSSQFGTTLAMPMPSTYSLPFPIDDSTVSFNDTAITPSTSHSHHCRASSSSARISSSWSNIHSRYSRSVVTLLHRSCISSRNHSNVNSGQIVRRVKCTSLVRCRCPAHRSVF